MESWMHRRIIVAKREILANLDKYHRRVLRAIRKDLSYRAFVLNDTFHGELLKLAILETFEEYYEE